MSFYLFLVLVCFVLCTHVISKKKSSCVEPKDVGPCRAKKPRWFFNRATSNCELFYYGGCKGNGNNFMSIEECKKKCPSPIRDQPEFCKSKPESGDCPGYFPRYYYDAEENKCESFIYSGCKGNENRFMTEQDCEVTCKQ